jgi:hypothetical protein
MRRPATTPREGRSGRCSPTAIKRGFGMTERVLGPTGSPRRRWTLLLPLVAVFALGLFYIAGAQAVHDLGAFELEGNATNDAALAGDDWDNVCFEVVGTGCTTTNATSAFGGATAVAWKAEPDPSASIFTGGGSKDPEDISNWAWKDQGGLPDKDNLLHSFAARYTVPTTGATGGCPDDVAPCDILYFGSDRFDNSGDAVQGFWFLQNEVSQDDIKSGGGFKFAGVHKENDLLVLSDFSNGGDVSTINIYRWVDSGGDTGTHLDFLAGGNNQRCSASLSADPFCGIVNPTNGTTAPWSFLDKSGNSTYLQGELFEAGVNLSSDQINLSGECFATLLSETRSSTSPTATLKDFVVDSFEACEAGINTEPSDASITLGESITDVATVTGTGGGTPTGNVIFHVCGPSSDGSDPDCSTGGTLVGSATGVALTPVDATTATAESAEFEPTAVGRYCFRGDYVPAPGSLYDPDSDFDESECFSVLTIPSTISTAQSWFPNDSATVTTTGPTGHNLTGSVAFSLYGDSACSGSLLYSQTVSIPANAGLSETVGTTNGNGGDASGDEAPTDVAITAATGTYSWLVVYTPAASDTGHTGSTRACHDEHSALTITNDDPTIP